MQANLSVVIIAYNEAENIENCIRKARCITDEIIVLDSYSSDGTSAIAEQLGATVYQQQFEGFASQKNAAAAYATRSWVLSLDADEVLSEALIKEINQLNLDHGPKAYFLKRCTYFEGKFIRHGSWYPDKQCRLWLKAAGEWQGIIHEKWRLNHANEKYGLLKNDLLHYSFNSISDYLKMIDRYTSLSAEEALAKGKKVGLLKLILGPPFQFFQNYILKMGFLDGYQGYLAYKLAAYGAFVKYSKIRQIFKQQHA